MVRLRDIAAQARVSVMTVSKALRDAPDIAPATKTRIKLVAQQMGYVPDSLAQSLRAKRTKTFGLMVSTLANPIYVRMVAAVAERTHELGYELMFAHTLNLPEREDSCIRRLLSRRVDGLFISPVYRMSAESEAYAELRARGTPAVILGQPAPFCRGFVSVASDDLAGSASITQHLLQLGHRRIAFLAGPMVTPWAQERLEGYRRGLRQAGLDWDDHLVFQAGTTLDDGARAAEQMLSEGCNATAVQAVNDLVAIGCAQTLLAHGIQIPRDMSVAGYGNILLAEHFRVPLTTARQPKHRLGMAAMELMLQLLRGEHPDSQRISAELIPRASTAPPPPPCAAAGPATTPQPLTP